MNQKLRINISVRKLNQLVPFKHEALAEEEYETREDFWAEAHALLDELEQATKGKKYGGSNDR